MKVRIRASLIIIAITAIILTFSIFAGIIFVRDNIKNSQEEEMKIVADIADHFISSEIELVKLRISNVIDSLTGKPEADWERTLEDEIIKYPDFIGMTVLDAVHGSIAK